MQSTKEQMTSKSPRIYTYKITFEEVPYYYYGVHKEKKFDEYYMGSPKTHRWAWEFYTPKKQILEFFDYSDAGWIKAQEVESRIIKSFYNTDKLCLNMNCSGLPSYRSCKKGGETAYKEKKGIYSLSEEELIERNKKAGQKAYEMKVGIHGRSEEQVKADAKRAGQTARERGVGAQAFSKEERRLNGSKGGIKTRDLKLGLHALTKEQRVENAKRRYAMGIGLAAISKEERQKISSRTLKNTMSQVWECTITGFRSTPSGLTTYQKNRNIDTSNRIRIK